MSQEVRVGRLGGDGLSQAFVFVCRTPQQGQVEEEEGVGHTHGAVHRRHQQGDKGQGLLPRQKMVEDLTDDLHSNKAQEVGSFQKVQKGALATGRETETPGLFVWNESLLSSLIYVAMLMS